MNYWNGKRVLEMNHDQVKQAINDVYEKIYGDLVKILNDDKHTKLPAIEAMKKDALDMDFKSVRRQLNDYLDSPLKLRIIILKTLYHDEPRVSEYLKEHAL